MNILQTIFAAVEPYLLELIAMIVTGIIARAAAVARTRWGLDIEARHREALHSAVMSAVRAAVGNSLDKRGENDMALIGETDEIDIDLDEVINGAISYVKSSVPDAVKALRPSDDVIRTLATSAIIRLAS